MKKKKKSAIREWAEAILIALVVVLIIRAFVFEAFMVPTSSMEKTLITGDFILVNKLSYGSRTPVTPLTFPFSHQNLPFLKNVKGFSELIKLPAFRLPATDEIFYNDVVVFNYPLDDEFPVDHKTHYVKRCVGLPGDTLIIKNGDVIVNYKELKEPENLQFNYEIRTTVGEPAFFSSNEFSEGGRYQSMNLFKVPLTRKMTEELSEDKEIVRITEWREKPGVVYDYIFPHTRGNWNTDHFGPLLIPKKGKVMRITSANLPIYRRVLENYEGNKVEEIGDEIYLNGEKAEFYTFKMNYYFMMGDNRHYSSDSRFWGFVPEDHIVGKASLVLFSLKPDESFFNKVRWNRFFKSI